MPRILSTPTILGGKKRISGTRISVDLVFNYVRAGKISQFKRDYPQLSDEQIETALKYLERKVKSQRRQFESAAA